MTDKALQDQERPYQPTKSTEPEIAAKMQKEAETAPEVPPNTCPHCGTEIISAGKFCGSCGKSLEQ